MVIFQDGKRRCDSACYDAKHAHCDCICGGINHKVGFEQALKNMQAIAKRDHEAYDEPDEDAAE